MSEPRHAFEESLISGYVDGELTQSEAQRVRIHLEDCAACNDTADELTKLREATMGSAFQLPDEDWGEAPSGGASRVLRNAGIVIALAWLVGLVGYIILELANSEDILGILLVGGFVLAAGLILASVVIDRLAARKTDRYRRVKK